MRCKYRQKGVDIGNQNACFGSSQTAKFLANEATPNKFRADAGHQKKCEFLCAGLMSEKKKNTSWHLPSHRYQSHGTRSIGPAKMKIHIS